MSDLINKYPYTDFHAVNLDYILKLVRENAGLHLEESGNQILLKTADNTIVSAITAPYAASAGSANTASSASYASTAGSASSAGYATNAGTAAAATNATNSVNANHAVTADSATSAASATTAATAAEATHAATASEATHAASADYATTTGNVEHALLAIENAEVYGNNLRFIKGNGDTITFTPNFASKSLRDNLNNIINNTYFANVVNNNGVLEFKDASGNTVKTVTPTIANAQTDSYGNTIADYVKSVSVESGSNYITVVHGTGTAETFQAPYSVTAWKDTNGNVIKNTYVKRLEIITDENDGQKKLVAYNGDNPEAELFRFPVEAYRAQVAAEADHAAAADYATSAGTAASSTGSVSSITRNRTTLTITNGDGTSTDMDLFLASKRYLYMADYVNNNTPILDPSFTVGHSEEIGITNYANPWGFETAYDAIENGVWIYVIDDNHMELFRTNTEQAFYEKNGDKYSCMQIKVFDPIAQAIKVFNITDAADSNLTPGNVTVTRVL